MTDAWQYSLNEVAINAAAITEKDGELIIPNVVITREGVQNAGFKPGDEIKKALRWANGAWVTDDHPPGWAERGGGTKPEEIGGHLTDIKLIDANARPAISATLHIVKDHIGQKSYNQIKAGKRKSVSIGFWHQTENKSGTYDKTGDKYEYIERNIIIEHLAVLKAGDKAACPLPDCGIGAGENAEEEGYVAAANKAVPSHEPPKADEGVAWDAAAAKKRLLKWAGGPDKESTDWAKFAKGFAWYNPDNPDAIGSYKLPHHDIIDGKFVVVWRGVAAAGAAIRGARGGVQIPTSELEAVKAHLARHYRQFDKPIPWQGDENMDKKPEGQDKEGPGAEGEDEDETKPEEKAKEEEAPESSETGQEDKDNKTCIEKLAAQNKAQTKKMKDMEAELNTVKGQLATINEKSKKELVASLCELTGDKPEDYADKGLNEVNDELQRAMKLAAKVNHTLTAGRVNGSQNGLEVGYWDGKTYKPLEA